MLDNKVCALIHNSLMVNLESEYLL